MKSLYIAEKPSVAQEFAKALKFQMQRRDGYLESEEAIVTWCVGHLVTMSYPESYDPALKKWDFSTIPFLPKEYKYEVIPATSKQFQIVSGLLNRDDVDTIYICTDSGREGEYIYRLVDQMAQVPAEKVRKRVWIDSQTEEEILRGIREAKPMSEYDNLSDAAYLRAKEDYLMGINFSRALSLKYGNLVKNYLKRDRNQAISIGRVMTCVLGMVVRREREIREFVKTPFYRVIAKMKANEIDFEAEWKAEEKSRYFDTPFLYKENGFKEEKTAKEMIAALDRNGAVIEKVEKKQEKKQPSLLYNLTELQNECSRFFKISPEETLKIVQELYEKKLVTYPRTDARVLSSAVAKEIDKNLKGLQQDANVGGFAKFIIDNHAYQNLEKSKYVDDKQITDHYAVIPTGQGFSNLSRLSPLHSKVYEVIARRFIAIFFPPMVYRKVSLAIRVPYLEDETHQEMFHAGFRVLSKEGFRIVMNYSFFKNRSNNDGKDNADGTEENKEEKNDDKLIDEGFLDAVEKLRKNTSAVITDFTIKEGETTPPKRYNSGSLMLAMENAGQLIEDEDLRAQIKGSGIGTSATRAGILEKLVHIDYLKLNKKTQVITPSLQGELIFDVVNMSIRKMLDPEMTASWERGLTFVAEGSVTKEEYMEKLETYVSALTNGVKNLNNQSYLYPLFDKASSYYKK